ncbi:MAG: nucleotide sugar dehydrogenase [Pseudomonadota bacterium]
MFDTINTATEFSADTLRLIDAKPSISVIGLGYVGAVSTACLSSLGHRVIGVDMDEDKVVTIAEGRSPIHEKDLGRLLSQGVETGLVSATTDIVDAVKNTDVTFVSVGTPTSQDGGCDTTFIRKAAQAIGFGLRGKRGYHLVVMRCSIPPGTTMEVMVPEIEAACGGVLGDDFGVCFNPEFLREGVAVADFHAPPKTVIGANDERAARILARIYDPVDANSIVTSIETAEMVKYVDNVWHAAKVCFANEIGRICKPMGVDSHDVMDIFVQDTKLNLSPYYLKPGFAFGGSCLPKEVRAMTHLAGKAGAKVPLIDALLPSNDRQIDEAVRMVKKTGATKVGILGLAFKPGTDDLRESPALDLIARLMADGIEVIAYDPTISQDTPIAQQLAYVQHSRPDLMHLVEDLPKMLRTSGEAVLAEAPVAVMTQATKEFRDLVGWYEFGRIIDLARLFDDVPAGINYEGIGW